MTLNWSPRLIVIALLALGAFGCDKPSRVQENAAVEPPLIEPKMAVGKVKAGMTVDQVIAALGEPQRRTANSIEYTRLGFAVMASPDNVVKVVLCGDVMGLNGPLVKVFTGRTKEGIGLNSTREQVEKAYGVPTSSERFPGGRESMKYENLGITFSLEGGKVHHMIVRLAEPEPPAPASIEVTK